MNGAKALLELSALIHELESQRYRAELESQRDRADAAESEADHVRKRLNEAREHIAALNGRLANEQEREILRIMSLVNIKHCCGVPMMSDVLEGDLCRAELARREKAGAK